MPKLIHCKTIPHGLDAFMSHDLPYLFHCANCNAALEAGIPDEKGLYYHCPSCGAVFCSAGVIPFEEADRLFPGEVF